MIGGERPMLKARLVAGLLTVTLVTTPSLSARPALAASAADINRDANTALAKLYENIPEARPLGANAKGILIFPSIVKAGFLFGAQYGEGALRQKGKTVGYYITVAASYGLQAGVQSFGYVLFFMSDGAIGYLDKSDGFEIGVGPSIVILDAGKAKTLTTTTARSDVYVFIFDQKGLMGGLGLQGSSIWWARAPTLARAIPSVSSRGEKGTGP
jgi:lipid-binding SYLF domain-containing protein